MTGLPLERTRFAGVYRRGSRFVVVYRSGGRQRKQAAATLAEARAIKLVSGNDARADDRVSSIRAVSAWVHDGPARVREQSQLHLG